MIVACLYSTPFLYSVSVFQKRHLPFLLWSLNPIIVLLPLKDAVILKSLPSRVPPAPAMLCPGLTRRVGGSLGVGVNLHPFSWCLPRVAFVMTPPE